jgi:ATP-dependent RNA helicase DDX3X
VGCQADHFLIGNNGDWHGTATKYEWKDEYGEVGPRIPELEKQLFGGEFQMRRGEHTERLDLNATIAAPKRMKIDEVCILPTR